jgi:hypothetical protein
LINPFTDANFAQYMDRATFIALGNRIGEKNALNARIQAAISQVRK